MWRIEEHRRVDRILSRSVPEEILKRYEKWKDIAGISGPQGLRAIKGFHDEALAGEWRGHRSSSGSGCNGRSSIESFPMSCWCRSFT
jgi:hypothetical protein